MSVHEQSPELATLVTALQAEVAALRAEMSAARSVRRRSRLQALVPTLSLLCFISLSLVMIPATRAQTPDRASRTEKSQPADSPRLTAVETEKSLASSNTTGGPLLIGQSNSPTSVNDTTFLVPPGTTQLMPSGLLVNNFSDASIAIPLRTGRSIAVLGSTSGSDPQNTSHVGVMGASDNAEGVYGYSAGADGTGVYGEALGTVDGWGVWGRGGVYGGYFRGDQAAIRLVPNATAGPPTTGEHERGELVVSSDGHLWFCRTPGTPGEWVRLDLGATFVPMVQR